MKGLKNQISEIAKLVIVRQHGTFSRNTESTRVSMKMKLTLGLGSIFENYCQTIDGVLCDLGASIDKSPFCIPNVCLH